jgi:Bacterial membrane protein YfhO
MIEPAPRDSAASPPLPSTDPPMRLWLGLLAVAFAVVLVHWPLLAGQIVFHRDSALWLFPARWFVRHALLSGQSPAWNPYQGLGFPLLADPQYALFYPPQWLFLLVPDGMVAYLVSWFSLAHLIWGGVGMALLTRRMGACSLGAAVAGLSWALSGHTTSAWMTGPLLLGHAWIPWVARGFLGLARRQGRCPLAGAVWPMAMSLLVGEVFMSAMALIFAIVVVLSGATEIRTQRSAMVTAAKSASAWLIAVAIAAVTWLPPLYMLGSTERAEPFDRVDAEIYSHHPLRVLEMVAPGALGDPTGEYPAGQWVGEPAASGAPLFFSSYLGVVTVALALLGLRRRRLQLGLAGASLLALFVAFGRHTPVHQIWRMILFPFAHMHSPEKYVVLVVAAVAPLAGLGASSMLGNERPGTRRLFLLGGALAGLASAAPALLPAALAPTVRAAGLRGLLALALLLALVRLFRRSSRSIRVVPLVLLALVALDLGIPASRLTGFGSAQLLTRMPSAASAILQDNGSPAPPRVYRQPNLEQTAAPLGPTATWRDSQERAIESLTPNTLNVFGLAVVPGYASAIPDLLSQLGPRTFAGLGRTLRLFSVPYLLVTDAGTGELRKTSTVTLLSHPLPKGSLLRLEGARPRVYLAGQIRSLSPAEAARHLLDEAVVSGQEVLVFTASQPQFVPAIQVGEPHPCTLESFANTRLVALCSTPSPTLAVFVEQYDPGWSALVDGKAAPLLRANLLMRAVPLPAGSHRIELKYRAPGLRLTIFLSVMGLLALFVLVATARGGPRRGIESRRREW